MPFGFGRPGHKRAARSGREEVGALGVAVVTGAGRGIGRSVARRLAADGYRIVAVDVDGHAASATAAEIGGEARTCDVAVRDAVQQLADDVAAAVGDVEVLVNNAGIWRFTSLAGTLEEDAARVLDVNLLGTLWCCQAFAPTMSEHHGGSIVNLSSGAATARTPGYGLYPSSKAGVEALTGQLALELGHHFGPRPVSGRPLRRQLCVTLVVVVQVVRRPSAEQADERER